MNPLDFSQILANCRISARNGGASYEFRGNYKFVAAAAIGAEIGNAIRSNRDYNDCMLASGAQIKPDVTTPVTAPVTIAQQSLPPPEPHSLAVTSPILPIMIPTKYPPITVQSALAQRSIDTADVWLRAQAVLDLNDTRSRSLYRALCRAGDQSSCVMAGALRSR